MHRLNHARKQFAGFLEGRPLLWRKDLADFLFALEPERLISLCRLVFAAFAFLAIYLDPTRPARNVDETYAVLIGYLVYSLVLSVTSLRMLAWYPRSLLIHATDIITVGILVHLTGGPDSPFFTFWTFTLLTATMRWSWRGSLITAAILTLQLIVVSWDDIEMSLTQDSELNRLILRVGYILVAAAMLGYFGAYRERTRSRLSRLARWPPETIAHEDDPPLANSLQHAAEVLGAGRVLALMQEHDEEGGRLAYWIDTSWGFVDIPDMSVWPPDLAQRERAFFTMVDPKKAKSLALFLQALLPPPPITSNSVTSREFTSYCTAPFRSLHYHGSVFVLDPRYRNEDILSLTQIVAARIASDLERFSLIGDLAAAVIARERVRLSRDMHDSVLQDLAAANLQIRAVANLLPLDTRQQLGEVSWLLQNQQRRIRRFIESARPNRAVTRLKLEDHLQGFLKTLGRQWKCGLELDLEPADLEVESSVSADICQIISEATANAVRHGNANRIAVEVRRLDDKVQMRVRDNGNGFEANKQLEMESEPYSLKERVKALGGRMSLVSSNRGIDLSIEFPL